jgi:hypothetical protein
MDGAAIRKQLSGLGPRKRGGRLPEALRREIAVYARQRRSAGIRLSDIARETGVSEESVRRWSAPPALRRRALMPVQVRSEGSAGNGIILQTAQGHRVTGLDLEGAVQLLRHLG